MKLREISSSSPYIFGYMKFILQPEDYKQEENKRIYLPDIIGKGYRDYWESKARYCLCKGSRGSKKSKTTALWFIYNIMKYPEANALCVRRFGNTLRDSCFSDLKWAAARLGVYHLWDFTVSPIEATYRPTGQKILFRGMDDGLKVTSISVPKGILCWVWVEEAYEITSEDDFNKLDMSIRGEVPPGLWKQIRFTFNPWSERTWLKERFFDSPSDMVFTKTTTYRCNEWLDDADIKIFEDMKENNPKRFKIEGDGEWGIAEGLIYEKFRMEDFDIQEIRQVPGIKSSFSLDFGFTDPNAFICAMVDNSKKIIYVFDEWYQTGTTNQKIAAQIKDMGYGGQRIICDNAEPKSIMEMQECGIKAEKSRKGKDSVNHGIQQIQNYEIVVHTNCQEFWKEINNYCWQKDTNGKPTDKPEHEFSHGPDALRYGVADLLLGDRFSFD